MYINGTGTSTPSQHYSQREVWEVLREHSILDSLLPRSGKILEKVLLGNNGIDGRHLAVEQLEEGLIDDPDVLHSRFATAAPTLASDAGTKALDDAGIAAGEIDALVVSTCTGYLCPGLSSYVLERLKLAPDTFCLDLVGQGCGAALPNLQTAESLVRSGGVKHVLCICVEVCSAAFYLDDDPGVLISACLFGDGAAAAVVSQDKTAEARSIEWVSSTTRMIPEDRESLRFQHRAGLLRNVLAPEVPDIAAKHAREVFDSVARVTGVDESQIAGWLWHAGGKNVLEKLQSAFSLTSDDVAISASLLRRLGNVSSPFVLFALDEARKRNLTAGYWWIASFGAGFSSHGALLKAS
jgi:alkylresorcinol/alkylpyrone synthase